ncbi:8261_t:CDS:2, partial [Diversispora eburnea]
QVDSHALTDRDESSESSQKTVSSLKSRFEHLNQQTPQASSVNGSNRLQSSRELSFPNVVIMAQQQKKQSKVLFENKSAAGSNNSINGAYDLRSKEESKIEDQKHLFKSRVNNIIANLPPKPPASKSNLQPPPSKPKPIGGFPILQSQQGSVTNHLSRSISPSHSNHSNLSNLSTSPNDLRIAEDHHDPFDDSQGIDPFADDNESEDIYDDFSTNVQISRTNRLSNTGNTGNADKPSIQKNKTNKPPLPNRPQMPPPPLPDRPPSLRENKVIKRRTSAILNSSSKVTHHPSGTENNQMDPVFNSTTDAPDLSRANRRPPKIKGIREINNKGTTRAFAIAGEYVITDSGHTRVWLLEEGGISNTISHEDSKITSLCWRPTRKLEEVGRYIWAGGQDGNLFAIKIEGEDKHLEVTHKAHSHPVNFILRHGFQLWTLDDTGKLQIWSEDDGGIVSLKSKPKSIRISSKQTCVLIVGHHLWTASGKSIEVFNPLDENELIVKKIDIGNDIGNVKCMTQMDNSSFVYIGHEDGKITTWDVRTFNQKSMKCVSVYSITSLLGVGDYLWAGFKTGMIYIYDVRRDPWVVIKDWQAHKGPVIDMKSDEEGLWRVDRLQVASCSSEGQIIVWDGLMEQDWIADEMSNREKEYCKYEEAKVLICSWNIDASRPPDLEQSAEGVKFLKSWFTSVESPDIIVIGFQEIVDLESKKEAAKTMLLTKRKKEKKNIDNVNLRYKAWLDRLVKAVHNAADGEKYEVISSENLIGLFTCIFVKESERKLIRDIDVTKRKTGLKGYHGNKGSIATRFIYDDSSICFVNCHLAAGQTKTVDRNNDAANILDNTQFPVCANESWNENESVFTHGGDGTMIFDHEFCFFSGDLNYRIDLQRDKVLEAIEKKEYALLLEHDQLFKQRNTNPSFRLRPFSEGIPNFAPTYKYNRGEDEYDTSEKRRTPAWCDRILYRGPSVKSVKQEHYRRYDVKVSDHRPISGAFKIVKKQILKEKQIDVKENAIKAWKENFKEEKFKSMMKWLESCGYEQSISKRVLKENHENLRKTVEILNKRKKK